ncbi:MAG: hypothetical protein LBU43_01945 [Candidatus Accumulibacter sp.]|jgi:hypothetical protein|nr:hypothetical protein [Accumulibacter sp.]
MSDDPVVRYEVALECIWAERGQFFQASMAEEKKPNPSPALVKYYDDEIQALFSLEENLSSKDTAAIDAILNRNVFHAMRTVVNV